MVSRASTPRTVDSGGVLYQVPQGSLMASLSIVIAGDEVFAADGWKDEMSQQDPLTWDRIGSVADLTATPVANPDEVIFEPEEDLDD